MFAFCAAYASHDRCLSCYSDRGGKEATLNKPWALALFTLDRQGTRRLEIVNSQGYGAVETPASAAVAAPELLVCLH